MNILVHVTSISRLAGGLQNSVSGLIDAQRAADPAVKVTVSTLLDEFTAIDRPAWADCNIVPYRRFGPAKLGFSVSRALERTSTYDVVQQHGIWQVGTLPLLMRQRLANLPVIVSPHGMADPWIVRKNSLRKNIALLAYARANLNLAKCIRVLNESELVAIRRLGITAPAAIIPNGVHPHLGDIRERTEIRNVLYLGRIDEKKRTFALLEAWRAMIRANPARRSVQLKIHGWGDPAYIKLCQSYIAEHSELRDRVVMPGPVFGGSKAAAFDDADLFVLPSVSEGLPMAVLEAWAAGLPVAMTEECNLPEGYQTGCAYRISSNPETLARELDELLSLARRELSDAGRKARVLASEKYSWTAIGQKMNDVCRWVSGSGGRPCTIV